MKSFPTRVAIRPDFGRTVWILSPLSGVQRRTPIFWSISKSSRDDFYGFCTLYVSMKCVFIYFSHSLFVYVFILCPEAQKCYVFWHGVRLFVYLCISIISRSPEMLCFQALCTLQDRFIISVVSFWNRHHNVLNKYKYCEQTLFCLFCYT